MGGYVLFISMPISGAPKKLIQLIASRVQENDQSGNDPGDDEDGYVWALRAPMQFSDEAKGMWKRPTIAIMKWKRGMLPFSRKLALFGSAFWEASV